MPKTITFLLIGLFFGGGLGFLIAASGQAYMQTPGAHHASQDAVHDHSAHDHGADGAHGDHKMIDAGTPAPRLALVIHPDGVQSRTLEIKVENFVFDPKGANGAHVAGKGHAHVYVNGVKFARAYGPWLHMQALPFGTHEIRVTLNANDHSHLAIEGQIIEAVTQVVIE